MLYNRYIQICRFHICVFQITNFRENIRISLYLCLFIYLSITERTNVSMYKRIHKTAFYNFPFSYFVSNKPVYFPRTTSHLRHCHCFCCSSCYCCGFNFVFISFILEFSIQLLSFILGKKNCLFERNSVSFRFVSPADSQQKPWQQKIFNRASKRVQIKIIKKKKMKYFVRLLLRRQRRQKTKKITKNIFYKYT